LHGQLDDHIEKEKRKNEPPPPVVTKPEEQVVAYDSPRSAYSSERLNESSEDNPQPKSAVKKPPVGGIKMGGFDPGILVAAALKRRNEKNLAEGALDEKEGTAVEVKTVEYEPTPTAPVPRPQQTGFNPMLGGDALNAALLKRKAKTEVTEETDK